MNDRMQSGRPPKYPWRDMAVGETFTANYCEKCIKPLIDQAEKATHREFEVVDAQRTVTVRRVK